eukprot:SAG22_NODE_9633_length_578_cov_1.089770_1_plen_23_part_10
MYPPGFLTAVLTNKYTATEMMDG